MVPNTRREFLADVGRGMLVASLGSAVAADLGLATASAAEGAGTLDFGKLEPLVALLQDTPPDKLMPVLVGEAQERHRPPHAGRGRGAGQRPRRSAASTTRATTRSWPSPRRSRWRRNCPRPQRPLPVLKVLYRNATHIQAKGGRKNEVLHPVKPTPVPRGRSGGEVLQEATRKNDPATAEGVFAGAGPGTPGGRLQPRPVLRPGRHQRPPRRAGVAGVGDARLHRQGARPHPAAPDGAVLLQREPRRPADRHPDAPAEAARPVQAGRARSSAPAKADDAWVESLAKVIYGGGREKAADAVAAALAEGFAPAVDRRGDHRWPRTGCC